MTQSERGQRGKLRARERDRGKLYEKSESMLCSNANEKWYWRVVKRVKSYVMANGVKRIDTNEHNVFIQSSSRVVQSLCIHTVDSEVYNNMISCTDEMRCV